MPSLSSSLNAYPVTLHGPLLVWTMIEMGNADHSQTLLPPPDLQEPGGASSKQGPLDSSQAQGFSLTGLTVESAAPTPFSRK